MTFGAPWWLLGLCGLPIVLFAYVTARRRRQRRSTALAAQGLVVAGGQAQRRWRLHLPFALFVVALALLVIATARPMATIASVRRQATVVLAIDVSNSMAAKDVRPSRIAVAKKVARAFVKDQPSTVRIGVVAFGATPAIVQRPTSDHAADLAAIRSLTLGGGTSLSAGILSALDAIAGKTLRISEKALNADNSGNVDIGYFGGTTIVLISDGENTTPANPLTMARVASTAGVRIEALGVGTTTGTTVEISGFKVATAADPATLKSVASVTNGAFRQADARGAASAAKSVNLHFAVVSEHTEISALFALGAVLVLVLGSAVSLAWFGRVM
ncbi:MAG TPA: VWA domain-containing protein [Solirubrobacteraceae bacterium]|jgi:Ca-activated chloride channel family protein|nr:VWA domain-containing protein [Solirubrobacteraceae bacterium]